MTKEEVTIAAMYLLAKRQGISTRSFAKVKANWDGWHRIIQNDLKAEIRRNERARAYAFGRRNK